MRRAAQPAAVAWTVRPYRPDDEAAIVRVWNAALASDSTNVMAWRTKVPLDPNSDPRSSLMIEAIRAYSLLLFLFLFRREVVPFRYEQWYHGASEMRGAGAGFEQAVALMEHASYYGTRRPVEMLGT